MPAVGETVTEEEIENLCDTMYEYAVSRCDEAYQFVLRNIRMGAEFGGLLRRDVYELPIDSIRELIAYAVSHRSYLDTANVQVALYDDRLEITSPGMLIGGRKKHRNHRTNRKSMGIALQ